VTFSISTRFAETGAAADKRGWEVENKGLNTKGKRPQ
jgi:hypothetical protein